MNIHSTGNKIYNQQGGKKEKKKVCEVKCKMVPMWSQKSFISTKDTNHICATDGLIHKKAKWKSSSWILHVLSDQRDKRFPVKKQIACKCLLHPANDNWVMCGMPNASNYIYYWFYMKIEPQQLNKDQVKIINQFLYLLVDHENNMRWPLKRTIVISTKKHYKRKV